MTASTKEGLQAQTLVYVTSSEEEIVKIRLNEGSENVYLKVGESKTIACQVSPTTIKANAGYTLQSVQVQMYQCEDNTATPDTPTDITSAVYNASTGEIYIQEVVGNVIITASAS